MIMIKILIFYLHRIRDTIFYKESVKIHSLDYVAHKELGIGKNNEELGINRRFIGEVEGYYEQNRELIKTYCQNDAEITLQLAEARIKTVYDLLGAVPKKWHSNASISKAYLKLKHPSEAYAFPKLIDKLPKSKHYRAFELIRNSYYGGLFFDAYLGNIGKVSELDINSAYPKAISELKSIAGASIKSLKQFDKTADYSFYRIKMKYPDFPFPYRERISGGLYHIIYPHTPLAVTTFTTGIELEYLYQKGIKVEVLEGIGIYCKSDKPEFEDYRELYNMRQKYKEAGNNAMQYMIKIVLNASYGCFAQSKGGYTSLTNFIYASYITAKTRLAIYHKADEIGWENVRSIKTDAIIYSGDYRYNSLELGDFKQEFTDNEVITYFTGLSLRNRQIDASRGFRSLTADDLLNAKGNNLTIKEAPRPVKLKEGIISKNFEDIADFKDHDKDLHLLSNVDKYVLDTENLTYEYLASHSMQTAPLSVRDDCALKPEMRSEYLELMKQARNAKQKTVTVSDKLEMKPDKIRENVFAKLKHLTYPRTFRDRERIKRIMTSKKVQNILGIYTVIST